MRLFVACEVAAPVKTAAAALIEELAQRASRLAPSSRITWLTADRLHVTVRFIGFVDDTRAASIRAALSDALPVSAFDLVVSGVGAFPPKGPPRVLWAGLTVGLNARNVFNTAPPFYNNPLGYGFDATNADVIGRFVSLQLTKSW